MAEGWRLIRSGITMDDPTAVGECLGCMHNVYEHQIDGQKVRVMEYGCLLYTSPSPRDS